MSSRLIAAVLVTAIAVSGRLVLAHHAFSAEFDGNTPVLLTGTVTKMEWTNPHAWIHIEVKNPDGTVQTWLIEAGSPNALVRRGLDRSFLKPGTVVTIDGFQAKDKTPKANGRDIKFADGRSVSLAAPGSGAPDESPR